MFEIVNDISSLNIPAWGNKKKYIAIHYLGVDGEGTWIGPDGCGAHYYIYWDGTIHQRCSHDAVPWAVGTAGYYTKKHKDANNYNTISIEMCVHADGLKNQADDKWWFTTETQEACAWLVKKLMKELNIPLENVLRHYDIVNKVCPAPYVYNNKYRGSWTWDEFIAKVAESDFFSVGTKYKTTCKLQVRKTPGGKAIKFTADTDKTKFVKTSTGTCKIRKDQVVECLEVKEVKGNVWIRIAEGWIAGHYKKKYKIKEYNETFIVRITKAKNVRIRKNHSSTSKVVSFIEPGTYTIVKTYDKWGLLASGAGWINMNLKSVEKI